MFKIFFTRASEKELSKLSKREAESVINKISQLNYPLPRNLDTRKMAQTNNFYRLRIGKIRAIFEIDRKTHKIWIRKIAYRGSVYKS